MNTRISVSRRRLAAVLIGGQLRRAIPTTPTASSEDGAVNHPIAVEPSYRDAEGVIIAGGADGMTPDDAAKFDAFVADYRAHGNGSHRHQRAQRRRQPRGDHLFRRAHRRHRHQPRQDPGRDP